MLGPPLHLLLAGVSVGVSIAMILLVAGDRALAWRVRALVVALAAAGAAHSLRTVAASADWGPTLSGVLTGASVLGVVALWQLVRVLFGERRDWVMFIAWSLAFLGLQLIGRLVWPSAGVLSVAISAGSIALVAHLLWILAAGRADDLDGQRRDARAWWLGAAGAYVLLVVVAHNLSVLEPSSVQHGITLILGQILLKLGWLWMCIRQPALLGRLATEGAAPRVAPVVAPADSSPPLPSTSQAALRLQAQTILDCMAQEHLYRQARLSVADLAAHLRLPEARVRSAINQHLGYRNFNVFLNSFRLQEAAERLRSADEAHLPVLTIALSVGFGSIGPFNRAFKDAHGVTPTEFRKAGGAAGAPEGPSPG